MKPELDLGVSALQATLDDPVREADIAAVRRTIDQLGIDAIYFQYVSITGRIMGKMIPARH